jgi:tRNA(Ile)-lysidine synthase
VSSSRSRKLESALHELPPAPQYWVAYSGGIDSHVLLHLLAERRASLPGSLGAVHVNHQIQQHSGDWEVHCRAVCEELEIPFHCLRVEGKARVGESPEAAARSARYRGLADWLSEGALLLTAQHQDDQAETLLLQLLRGAGPKGLAAMPRTMCLGRGRLVRPFLDIRRESITAYAREHRLCWVEDPTNTDIRYDRNLLRHQVMPYLQQRWPGVTGVLARAAAHQSDQSELADALAAIDVQQCGVPQSRCLSVPATQALSPARQRNLLRYWLRERGFSVPPRAVLERIRDEILSSRADASPLVHWPGAEVRRYRERLFVMHPLAPHDPSNTHGWRFGESLDLMEAGGRLSVSPATGAGLRRPDTADRLEIRFRRGGETLQPAGDTHHRPLKKLLQQWGVPEWERARIPLVYSDNELIAVAGFCVCEGFQAGASEAGVHLSWSRVSNWR